MTRLALTLAVVTGGASLLPGSWEILEGWPLRGAALATWLAVTLALPRRTAVPAWLTPSYLLPSMALMLYSLLPSLWGRLEFGPPIPHPPGELASVVRTGLYSVEIARRAMGSTAELMVVQFSVVGLAIAMLACCAATPDGTKLQPTRPLQIGAAMTIGLAAAASYRFLGQGAPTHALAPVVVGVALAHLTLWATRGSRPAAAALVLTAGGSLGLMLPGATKYMTLVLFPCFATLIATPSMGRSVRASLLMVLIAAPLAGQLVLLAHRVDTDNRYTLAGLHSWFRAKLVFRQTETIFCLEHAAREAATARPGMAGLWYFGAALVPRAFWPDKPNLSIGHVYALAYCGWIQEDFTPTAIHSASITLLGEPLLKAGPGGLVLFALVVLGALMPLSRLQMRGDTGAAIVIATLPYLIDFDQLGAIYVGNAIKFGLVATAVTLALARLEQR